MCVCVCVCGGGGGGGEGRGIQRGIEPGTTADHYSICAAGYGTVVFRYCPCCIRKEVGGLVVAWSCGLVVKVGSTASAKSRNFAHE